MSLNVQGIRSSTKRKALFCWLAKRKYDIVFLQETYSTIDIESVWRTQWQGKLYFSHGSNKSCGSCRTLYITTNVASSPLCSFCEKENESLEHIFIHSNYAEEFWAEVIKWLRSLNVNISNVNDKELMLGMPNCKDELFVNHVLLIAKQYLYFCRCRKTFRIFKVFMSRLRKIQNLELVIAKSKNMLALYTAKWGILDL